MADGIDDMGNVMIFSLNFLYVFHKNQLQF